MTSGGRVPRLGAPPSSWPAGSGPPRGFPVPRRRAPVRAVWVLDGGATNDAFRAAQAVGGLTPWPDTVEVILTHPGAWLFLDGGTLDLGVVRDSTLNASNSWQSFSETFENAAFVGLESLCATFDLCPDGSSSGTAEITPCATGS